MVKLHTIRKINNIPTIEDIICYNNIIWEERKIIIIYTLPTCPHCHQAKNFLNTYKIPYTEYDVSRDPQKVQEMYTKSGQGQTPVIDVDGQIIIGFNQQQLTQVLRMKGYLR